jgi:DNA-binding NarL/FixJ family response regulator
MNRGAKAFISKNHKPEVVFEAIRRVHEFGIYRDNLPFLLKNPSIKDGHYYRLLFTRGEIKLRAHLLNTEQTYEDIALLCSLSKKTIEKRATTIFEKATVKNRGGFIKWAMKSGVNFIAEE